MLLHDKQKEVALSDARYKVIRAGRRSGKTAYEIEGMLFKAISKTIKLARQIDGRAVIFIAPTQKQARSIVWEAFKSRLGKIGEYNESRLEIKLPTEDGGSATIFIGGWENRENYRGMPNVIHITFDETDTMRDFFVGWQEIFRPMLIDTGGGADFIGTPKKENPNLIRLEKEFAEKGEDFASFHFTTSDNPHIPPLEIEKARKDMDADTYRQEILAEYVDNAGALFRYTSLLDMFSNSVLKDGNFLTVDIADDGSDKTIFTFWHGLDAYKIDRYAQLQTDGIINQIREDAAKEQVPYSHIAVDAIGVGAGVASSPLLTGIVGFKSSYGAIRTTADPTRLPNVHYLKDAPLVSVYKNLRSQCIFTLATLVNDHKVAVSEPDQSIKTEIIEELSNYQDVSQGDGKRMATQKEDVKTIIGHSPDISDTLLMRMYFEITEKLSPQASAEVALLNDKILLQFQQNENRSSLNSNR